MNGYIEIYDKGDALKYSVLVTEKCIYSKTLMEEEYVLISFVSDVLLDFAKGDYINTQYGRFTLTDVERPTLSNEGGYQYEQKFHAPWQRWKERFAFYNRQIGSEKAWKMTQKPEYFMDIIVGNIRDAGFGEYLYDIDGTLNEMKLVEFDATSICDALTKVAETWDTEWWIEGNVIHLSKCEFGSPVKLETNVEVTNMDRSEGQENKRYTRLYAFGSSRNLPKNYRKETSGVVIDGVVEARLKLPEGTPYVDAWENMSEDDIIEGIEIFENVYPRRIGTISDITTKEYTDEIDDEEGKRFENWNAYRYKDAALTFFKDYILDGEELHIIFQTGKLAGMDFVVNFNPEGEMERLGGSINPNAQLFEIVRNENYGIPLPSDDFHPDDGDTYILYGYDSTKLGEMGFISSAENELLQEAIKAVEKAAKDKSVFSCPTNPIRCAGYTETGGRLTHRSTDEIDLDVGQIVKLVDPRYFDGEGRLSRVRSFEKRLDNNYSATYECGETRAYSRSEAIKEQIQELTFQSRQYISTGGSSVYLIKRYDTTTPTDSNAFSAKRSQYEFLSRIADDIAQGHITFDDGLTTLASAFFKNGAEFGEYRTGASGAFLGMTETGSYGEVDYLKVRKKAQFETLEIAEVRYVGGKLVVSPGDGVEIIGVEELETGYKCYYKGSETDVEGHTKDVENKFRVDDQIYCKTTNVADGEFTNRYWWRLCTEVGDGWFVLDKVDCDRHSDVPCVGDRCAQLGNRRDRTRQSAIILSTVEVGHSPLMALYGDINSYSLEGKDHVSMGAGADGVPFLNVYGKAYIGTRNESTYIKYTPVGGVEIKAKISAESSIGNTNITQYITNSIAAHFADDGLITPAEKKQLLLMLLEIRQEYTEITKVCDEDGIDHSGYDDAFWALLFWLTGETKEKAYLMLENGAKLLFEDRGGILIEFKGVLSDPTTTSPIDREEYSRLINEYYAQKNLLQYEQLATEATGDYTQTIIDGGLVTTGSIELKGASGVTHAGITGSESGGEDDIRIWAGATKQERTTAPFRVSQKGEMWATEAHISGDISASTLTLKAFNPENNGLDDDVMPEMLTQALVVSEGGYYLLPKLAENATRVIELLIVKLESATANLSLQGVDNTVVVCQKGEILNGRLGAESEDLGIQHGALSFPSSPGLYRLIGWGMPLHDPDMTLTVWNVVRIDDGTDAKGRTINGSVGKDIPNRPPYSTIIGDIATIV